jgi:D-glycero-D-manno-heptose 1,7-bisphosphate phosphatase
MSDNLNIDENWTLFLDRDGVINHKIEGNYVKCWNEFDFIEGSLKAISNLSKIFNKIIVVTNQRGIGKGLFSLEDLKLIHDKMLVEVKNNFGKINKIYFCTDISDSSEFRKPNIGMGIKAKSDFPEINFKKSIMVGDSISDMMFGHSLGMNCFLISDSLNKSYETFSSLQEFSEFLINKLKKK